MPDIPSAQCGGGYTPRSKGYAGGILGKGWQSWHIYQLTMAYIIL